MKTLKLSLCFLIILSFTACTAGEFRNIISFIDTYNELSDIKLSLSDFIVSDKDYTALIENNMSLNLKEDKDGRIYMCRLAINKSENAADYCGTYTEVLLNVIRTYCSYDTSKALEIIKAFSFDNKETLMSTGELTLNSENFSFVYYSNEVTSEFRITNTYLKKTETTEKPVSKPYYGENFIEKD